MTKSRLGTLFSRLAAELDDYLKEGFKMMIENGWAEQPPLVDDRRQLATKQNKNS